MKDMGSEDWRRKLTKEQYHIMREKGTELPFSGKLLNNKDSGDYTCVACGQVLFRSGEKFDSNTGWPSFYDVAKKGAVKLVDDDAFGMHRIEVECAKCGGHLGHVFDDGPGPTGKRYCINSTCLAFAPNSQKNK